MRDDNGRLQFPKIGTPAVNINVPDHRRNVQKKMHEWKYVRVKKDTEKARRTKECKIVKKLMEKNNAIRTC